MPQKAIFETKVTDVWTATDAPKIGDKAGDIRWEGGKCYKCVIFDNGAGNVAAVAGTMAAYFGTGADYASPNGYSSNKVTLDTTDHAFLAAGVFQSVPADGEYCWVQIKGVATMTVAAAAGSDGDPMTLAGATADTGDLDVSAAVTDHVCAYADDISAKIFVLDCPF